MPDHPDDLEDRVGILEREVLRLREQVALSSSDAAGARVLAAGADRDVSEVRAELRAHTKTLNALRETQLEQDRKLTELDYKLTGLDQTVTGLDHKLTGLDQTVTGLDHKVTEGFAALSGEMAQITALLSGRGRSGHDG